MPLQPRICLVRVYASTLRPCHSCRVPFQLLPPPFPRRIARLHLPQTSSFHSASHRSPDALPNHYETLELTHTASASDIKRQFYTLSKKHHPDHNPTDPDASTRFVAISEAYHVLSVPEKRAHYDAQLSQHHRSRHGRAGSADHPQGSYSSASYAGSRPASGLNKKRSTFRGPPPSFYNRGGYGRHGAKRAEYAHHQHAKDKDADDAGEGASGSAESYPGFAGFGPGQTGQGYQVPHFDDRKHKVTHDQVNEYIYSRRRKARAAEVQEEMGRSNVANFVMVSSVLVIAGLIAKTFGDESVRQRKDKSSKT